MYKETMNPKSQLHECTLLRMELANKVPEAAFFISPGDTDWWIDVITDKHVIVQWQVDVGYGISLKMSKKWDGIHQYSAHNKLDAFNRIIKLLNWVPPIDSM